MEKLRTSCNQLIQERIQQVTPVLNQDYYSSIKTTKNGKRILTEQKEQYEQTTLGGEDVKPKLNGDVKFETGGMLQKEYSIDKSQTKDKKDTIFYDQKQKIENGALLESSTKSGSTFENNSQPDPQDNKQKDTFMKKIDVQSSTQLKFVRQEDEVSKEFIQNLKSYHEQMSFINFTSYKEALDLYRDVFAGPNTTNSTQQRLMFDSQDNIIGTHVDLPLLEFEFSKITIGINLRSVCIESRSYSDLDKCDLIIFGTFMGQKIKLTSQRSHANFSAPFKIIKILQYTIDNTLNHAKYDANYRQKEILLNTTIIIDKMKNLFTFSENTLEPVFRMLKKQDKDIFNDLNSFYHSINTGASKVQNFFEEALEFIKIQTIQVIYKYQISLNNSLRDSQSIFTDFLDRDVFQNLLKETEIDPLSYDLIKSKVEDLDNSIEFNINYVLNNEILNLQNLISKQAYTVADYLFTKLFWISKDKNDDLEKLILKTAKAELEYCIQDYWHQCIYQIQKIRDLKNNLYQDLQKKISSIKQSILEKLGTINKNNNKEQSLSFKSITNKFIIFENWEFEFTFDLEGPFSEIQQSFNSLLQILPNLIQGEIEGIKNSLGIDTRILPKLPIMVQNSTEMIKKNIKENQLNTVIELKAQVKYMSKQLEEAPKNLFQELKRTFSSSKYPETHESYQKPDPLFNDLYSALDIFKLDFKFDEIIEKQKLLMDPSWISSNLVPKIKENIDKILFANSKAFQMNLRGISDENTKASWDNYHQTLNQFDVKIGNIRKQIFDYLDGEYSAQIQPGILDLKMTFEELCKRDLQKYQDGIMLEAKEIPKNYKEKIKDTLNNMDFEIQIKPLIDRIPYAFYAYFPTPIGILIELKIQAAFIMNYIFSFGIKKSQLKIAAGAQVYAEVFGSISANAVVAEIGGYAKGTLLQTTLQFFIAMNLTDFSKGTRKLGLYGSIQPYNLRMGIYFSSYLSISSVSCDWSRRRQLGLFSFFKKVVKAVKKAVNVVVNVVKKIWKCISSLRVELKRYDIIDPITLQSNKIEGNLFEISF